MPEADRLILERADRFVHDYLAKAVVADRRRLGVRGWVVPGEAGLPGEPVPFATLPDESAFATVDAGEPWGRAWGTTWFLVDGEIPTAWGDRAGRIELSLDLGFSQAKPGFQCEGLVRTPDGRAVKGLEPRNHHVPLEAGPGSTFRYYVEAASNPDLSGGDDFKSVTAFRPTSAGDAATAGEEPLYRLGRCEVRLVDTGVEELRREVAILCGLARELTDSDPRRARILDGVERALYAINPDEPSNGVEAARGILRPLLASPAAPSAHRIVATGHAHIDSAWLWPARETVRKVARTFANVLELMDRDADLTFVSSSAQHFAWVKQNDPELYERVRRRVAEGRFLPVGNMWVESDVNMPSGESLARQLLYGTRFFEDEFGARSDVGWLPDSFGFPASLPQLLRSAGLRWFFTQKMCWNDVNTMPHHTFRWEGLDGTRIFTHFPPNNTYSGDMRPTELARSVRNFSDHAHASSSLMPFGYGDGGGGPTREMMADGRAQSDLEGSPRLRFGGPREFFLEAEEEYADAPIWSGEMYLEFHRGIYTSQSRTKRGNRRNEWLLVEAELWCAAAALRTPFDYPYEQLDELWREVLLLQFHDILPGSAIAWVHREAERSHARVTARLEGLIEGAVAALADRGDEPLLLNPAPVPAGGVPAWGAAAGHPSSAPRASAAPDGGFRLQSAALTVEVAADGTLASVVDVPTGRELLAPGGRGNLLQLHVDAPAKWDAWELDRSYRLSVTDLVDGSATLAESGDVHVVRRFGTSRVEQWIGLDDSGEALRIRTRVEWHERHRLLKLAFPLDVHAMDAAYETQFGHVRRAVHTNTSWDAARYEVCAHRWVHVGEPGFGVAVVNDGLYGHDVTRQIVQGRVSTVVRQSLLRAPTFPDPDADRGEHEFVTVLAPAARPEDAARWGALVGSPVRAVRGAHAPEPLVQVQGDGGVVLSAAKLAADRSGDLIVRVFEQRGARSRARLRLGVDVTGVRVCDLVETPDAAASDICVEGRDAAVELSAFQVLTLRVTPASAGESRA
ncbi:glycosyl hydrolase-related protein [Microbacterium sp. HD4P20]|uniref:alpha-mannosidase n=1 Tax=Microbacterium sp. HD4P20 TaxID=2864874 RepID=UPI001C63C263|nr:glycoside hydrolase family 38 C-terminal domain-containing protein [Microbacterium sp. HD4P20]MCP2635961.1 glycosyl hydrolase-related protein [Microbacterium sp. HD4P20]